MPIFKSLFYVYNRVLFDEVKILSVGGHAINITLRRVNGF